MVKAFITAIDHNANCNRGILYDKYGRENLRPYRTRHETEWRLRTVRKPKDTGWRTILIEESIRGYEEDHPVVDIDLMEERKTRKRGGPAVPDIESLREKRIQRFQKAAEAHFESEDEDHDEEEIVSDPDSDEEVDFDIESDDEDNVSDLESDVEASDAGKYDSREESL